MPADWVTDNSSIGELRDAARAAAERILQDDDPREAAMALWKLGLNDDKNSLNGGLWQIWGRITDEWTAPNGDEVEGAALARESAQELLQALGDDVRERAYCVRWVYERLDIILPG